MMKRFLSTLAIVSLATVVSGSMAFAEDGAPKKGKDRMAAMDTDGNGELSKDEFSAAMKEKGKTDEQIDRMFDKLDGDGDGSLTKKELRSGKKKKDSAAAE